MKQITRFSGLFFFLMAIAGLTASPLTQLTVSQSYYAPGSLTPVVTSLTLPYPNGTPFGASTDPDGSFVGVSVGAYAGEINLSFQSCENGAALHVGTFTGADLGCGPGTGTIGLGFALTNVFGFYEVPANTVSTGSVTISQVSFDSSGNLLSFAASYMIDSLVANPAYPGTVTYSGVLDVNADQTAPVPEPASTGFLAGGLLVFGGVAWRMRRAV